MLRKHRLTRAHTGTHTQVFFTHPNTHTHLLAHAVQQEAWRRLHRAAWRVNGDPTVDSWASRMQHAMRHRS